MAKRYIILKQAGNSSASGMVTITDTTVTVSVSGAGEEYGLYFTSKQCPADRIDAGTIRSGMQKTFELSGDDTKKIDTVLLTRDGRTVISGTSAHASVERMKEKAQNTSPLGFDDGFTWVRIDDGRFAENVPIIRHIFENINVIARISKHRYYYYGTSGQLAAVAVPSSEGEGNPFLHLSDCARYVNGYWVVCANKEEKYFYSVK